MLGAFLTMFLDVIIDPIAHLGEQWFLGKIYYYPNPAWYFDVPLSNFAGWFLVSATVIGLNEGFWHFLSKKEAVAPSEKTLQLCCYFFCSIALFNIIVTFSIGAWTLGVVSSTLLGSCLAAMYYTSTYHNRHTTSQN